MQTTISSTYKEEAEKWVSKKEENVSEISFAMVTDFANYLDSFATIDDKLQILAYQKAREIDGEVLFALANEIPKEKIEQIVRSVHEKHRHTKITQQPTEPVEVN